MEFLELATSSLWGFVSTAVPFLFVLTVIVFVHEYGHFKVARMCGVGVDTFAVGFGKEIWGGTDRYGTRWKLGWIPIGGYVKFEDDANATSQPSREEPEGPPSETAFHNKPLASRAAVVAAGPIANFILALIIYTAAFTINGIHVAGPVASEVMPGGAAAAAGMQDGDRFLEIDGYKIETFADIQHRVWSNHGDAMKIKIQRGSEIIDIVTAPLHKEIEDPVTGTMIKQRQLGIKSKESVLQEVGLLDATYLAAHRIWFITTHTVSYVGSIIRGRESVEQLAGPLGIARTTGYAAAQGINALFQLAALLSVSIGLINLFPIPMLDGGHLMYYAVEAVRGKPLGPEAQDLGFKVGFALVLTLMIVATWNDIAKFFS
jgi:regulator of sigma E protease